MTEAVRAIFDRIPALRALRGSARIEAEEVLEGALEDAAEEALFPSALIPDDPAASDPG